MGSCWVGLDFLHAWWNFVSLVGFSFFLVKFKLLWSLWVTDERLLCLDCSYLWLMSNLTYFSFMLRKSNSKFWCCFTITSVPDVLLLVFLVFLIRACAIFYCSFCIRPPVEKCCTLSLLLYVRDDALDVYCIHAFTQIQIVFCVYFFLAI